MTANVLHLNHAGTSWPKPQAVIEAVQAAFSTPPTEWPRRFEEAHEAIAEFFGVSDSQQILLTPGCTSALAVGIGDALILPGQRVLTSRWEHHAVHRPLLKLAAAESPVEYIPPQVDEATQELVCPIDLDWLESALAKRDVALVAITAACNVTGERLPYDEVIRVAHKYESTVLLDAAQVVGWEQLDLPKLGADLVAFGGHKGLQAPWGIGGLYVSERVRMQCATATCALPAGSTENESRPRPGYCDVGSVDQLALAGLHAAVVMLGKQDLATNLASARSQIRRLREALASIEGVQFFRANDHGMPSLAVNFSGKPSSAIAAHLERYGLIVGSGIQCAPLAHETLGTGDSGLVRFSVGVAQPDAQIEEAINRLRAAFDDAYHEPPS